MSVDISQLLGREGFDYHYARRMKSFHWFMPVEDERPEEFPHQDRRISLEDMRRVKGIIVSEAGLLSGNGDAENYIHPAGVFVEFGLDGYLPKSVAEVEKHPLMNGAHPTKDVYTLAFYSVNDEAIRGLAGKCGLTCVDVEE